MAAGSAAAGVQSAVYGGAVASGSVFAGLQSAGAAGIGLAGKAAIASTAAGAAKYIKDKVSPCKGGPKCPSDDEFFVVVFWWVDFVLLLAPVDFLFSSSKSERVNVTLLRRS